MRTRSEAPWFIDPTNIAAPDWCPRRPGKPWWCDNCNKGFLSAHYDVVQQLAKCQDCGKALRLRTKQERER